MTDTEIFLTNSTTGRILLASFAGFSCDTRPGGEMANTLVSGTSARKGLEVQLLSWA